MSANAGESAHVAEAPPTPNLFQGCLTGTFQHTFGADTIQWSDEVYEIHGYRRGDVVPTFALGLGHVVPEQRQDTTAFWTEIGDGGGPLSIYLTLRDARGGLRQVLATGDHLLGSGGEPIGVWGLLIDLTRAVHMDSHRLANEAVAASALKRGVIEQSKGVLAGRTGVSTADAYELIRQRSQDVNRKVSAIAQDVVDAAVRDGAGRTDTMDTARAFLEGLEAERLPEEH